MRTISLQELRKKGWKLTEDSRQSVSFYKMIKTIEKIAENINPPLQPDPIPVNVSVKQDPSLNTSLREMMNKVIDLFGKDCEVIVTERDSNGLIKKLRIKRL